MSAQYSFTKRIDFEAQCISFYLNLKLVSNAQYIDNQVEYLHFYSYLHNNFWFFVIYVNYCPTFAG